MKDKKTLIRHFCKVFLQSTKSINFYKRNDLLTRNSADALHIEA